MNKHKLEKLCTRARQDFKYPFFTVKFEPTNIGNNKYMACFNKLDLNRYAEYEETDFYVTAPTLQKLRRLMPSRFHIFKRDREDAPSIVETWM